MPQPQERSAGFYFGALSTSGRIAPKWDSALRVICTATFCWLAFALADTAVNGAQEPKASDPRPNILYCLADDWSWPHAGVYGDKVIKTPNFDRVAREGVLFTHVFCATPS